MFIKFNRFHSKIFSLIYKCRKYGMSTFLWLLIKNAHILVLF